MKKIDIKSVIIGILGTMIFFFFLDMDSYYNIDDVMSKLDKLH